MGGSGVLSDILPFVPGKDFYSYPLHGPNPTKPKQIIIWAQGERTSRAQSLIRTHPCQFNVGPREVLAQAKSDNTHTHTPTKSNTYTQATENLTVNEGSIYIGLKMGRSLCKQMGLICLGNGRRTR